jgi:hypothetical protein
MSIFKGNTVECIQHFANEIKTRRDHFLIRKKVADFVGAGESAVYRWFSGKNPPVGEGLIKIRFYLEHQGYEVKELAGLRPEVRDAARLYAFGILTLSELVVLFGHPPGRGGLDTLLSVFRGMEGISSERAQLYREFISAYAEQLPAKQQELQKIELNSNKDVPAVSLVRLGASERSKPKPAQLTLRTSIDSHEAIMVAFSGQVKALIPLAELIESDTFTPEQRARTRELAGGDGVFKVANMLFRLCGERARNMH